ncbi:MAG: hemolysin III family protein [Gammaproteobacteria bacterium]|nr:hemolysin III family protein [Rhodocyclaceae bacterium]MBU3909569.1 hemolysin III family protein [Gammaproteobacteria bacterium]MBU3990744.1 hemolysin III family protein [Gammaproteobacteria bacterium]MBU4003232.1 hemolysin III family protein [Gammaproteobacteria bacterium]MBU4022281.1 hemolysin III family protein [Gammaproteobacteria bacterium]
MYYGEKFNAVTHLIGAILAFAGAILLVVLSALDGDPWKVLSVSIYGATLVLLYSASTLYHSLRGRAKDILRKFDHHSIYLLIAGSYTPFCLVTLRGPWGWSLFCVVWGLAVLGILQEMIPARNSRSAEFSTQEAKQHLGRPGMLLDRLRGEARILSVAIYVVMGWVALVAIVPLLDKLGFAGFAWLAAGGLFYTIGIIFFALDTRLRHAHGIWHLFVIAGSAAHFIAILYYVL